MTKKERFNIWYIMITEDMSDKAWDMLAEDTSLAEYKEEFQTFRVFLLKDQKKKLKKFQCSWSKHNET